MKKGQVTIFVILGVVILIIGGIFLYFYSLNNGPKGPVLDRTIVSSDMQPIQEYFEQCLNQLGTDGIVKLGQHGGYIDPNDAYLSGRLFIKDRYKQYESDLAYISAQDKDSAVAYWYYGFGQLNLCENCIQMSQAPYIADMQDQLSKYLAEKMPDCLGGFQSFKDKGFTIDYPATPEIVTTITDNDVIFQATYEVNVTQGSSRTTMDKYYTRVNIPLKKYYDMALNISRNSYYNSFLETMDMFFISSYSGLDTNKLPPIYDTTEGYDLKFWSELGSKQKFKDILSTYLPLFQVVGTKNYKPVTTNTMTSYEKNLYKTMSIDFFNGQNNKNTEINFLYLGQDIYFHISPSKGDLIGPKEYVYDSLSLMPAKKVNEYNFYYSLSYPVIVEIKDEYSKGNFYTFLFALQSNIVNNQNLQQYWDLDNGMIPWNKDYMKLNSNDALRGTNVQGDVGGKLTNYSYKQRSTQNLFCIDTQRISGLVTVKTYDSRDNTPLSNVTISYGCGNYISCDFGLTEYNDTLGYAAFSARMPICMNGFISLEAQGFMKKIIPVTTEIGKDDDLGSVYLDPIATKKVSVKRYVMHRNYETNGAQSIYTGNVMDNTTTNLSKTETVMLTLTRINTSMLEETYTQTAVFGNDSYTNLSTMDLAPGRYTIKAQLIDHTPLIIPKECKEICVGKNVLQAIFGGCKTEKIPKEQILMNISINGGVEFTDKNSFIITRNDIQSNRSLEFYVAELPPTLCIDDLSAASELPVITQTYRQKLLPRWKV